MSSSDIAVKRLRRRFEPDEKVWNDDALETPWEDVTPPLQKETVFALRNVFFFSHATAVQARVLSVFAVGGQSALVEAPTGSGKTLAVLIPLMERTLHTCAAHLSAHSRPLLRRDIVGAVLSPSRALAEQTFLVGRNLAARCPHAVRFALCDGAMQSAEETLAAARAAPRGGGTILVSTPNDFVAFLRALRRDAARCRAARRELLDAQSDATRQRALTRAAQRTNAADPSAVRLRVGSAERFVLVMDEADLLFAAPEMRGAVVDFIDTVAQRERDGRGAKRRKRERKEEEEEEEKMDVERIPMDLAFVGATVSTSVELQSYAKRITTELRTELHTIVLNSTDDFAAQLQNRYLVCEAHEFLPLLVQLMNVHTSKKHFIFFNSPKTLLFVEKLLTRLAESERPLLYIKKIFVMYEGMSEGARLEQYNAFLTHRTNSAAADARRKKSAPLSFAEKKNQIYTSGWKRDGRAPDGKGAILLCTDVAAFGLDVRDVDYVYHFEPPTSVQTYVHRIGRVGRMGMRGSSILILPCVAEVGELANARERKTGGARFNTATNTKSSTAELQMPRVTEEDLSEERQQYIAELGKRSALQPCAVPPFAPITATVRNVIAQSNKLKALARSAALSMCAMSREGEKASTWFDPKLALCALLLD